MSVTLRPFTEQDESAARAAWAEFQGTAFEFLFDFNPDEPWSVWTSRMDRYYRAEDLPADRVRAAFLAAEADGQLVGAVSVRLALNDYLATRGGHIGYGVISNHRRKGYATTMLREAIEFARREDVDEILVTVDDDNTGSIRVIENCDGRLEQLVRPENSTPFRRYWF